MDDNIILVKFTIKPNKFLAKKKKVIVVLGEENIRCYFNESATPYDLSYIYTHRNNANDIRCWIRKIAVYSTDSNEVKTLPIVETEISDEDVVKMRSIIEKIAKKYDNLIEKY